MDDENTARKEFNNIGVRFPNAVQQPPKAIAPPAKQEVKKERPSLADLRKQAGG